VISDNWFALEEQKSVTSVMVGEMREKKRGREKERNKTLTKENGAEEEASQIADKNRKGGRLSLRP